MQSAGQEGMDRWRWPFWLIPGVYAHLGSTGTGTTGMATKVKVSKDWWTKKADHGHGFLS